MSRITIAVLVLLAAVMHTIQIVTNHPPPIGAIGLILFAVPGFVVTQALPPSAKAWPEISLVILASTLTLLVLTGILAALSPHGLDASSVASIQLLVLSAATSIWIGRLGRSPRNPFRPTVRVDAGSLLLGLLGLALGIIGLSVATRAAEDQAYAPFVQLWSVPSLNGGEQVLGVRNATGRTIDCEVTVDRPSEPSADWDLGRLDDGQTWQGQLPRNEGSDRRPWEILLRCAGLDGSTFDRRLSINPPA